MSVPIPENKMDLLNGPVVVTLVTLMPDLQPQATPVWCSFDGTHILVNTAKGRQKDRNMRERPQVTVLAIDPKNPYRWLEVRGEVDEITEEGAVDHINSLSQLYLNKGDYYEGRGNLRSSETRVIYKIKPQKVVG